MQLFQLKYFKFIITNDYYISTLNGNTHYIMQLSAYKLNNELNTQQHTTEQALVIRAMYMMVA